MSEMNMLKKTLSTLLIVTAAAFATPAVVYAEDASVVPSKKTAATKAVKSVRIDVDGIQYHYQIRGQGAPLLLLHGGLGSTDMFAPIMPMLGAKRQIIGVDLQGHGRTAMGTRPISMPTMGADMAVILKKLGYGPVDVMGYSMGAGVAFQLATQHPQQVRRLVLVSGSFAKDGFFPEMIEAQGQLSGKMAEGMKDTPMAKSYAAVAPNPGLAAREPVSQPARHLAGADALRHFPVTAVADDRRAFSGREGFFSQLGQISGKKS